MSYPELYEFAQCLETPISRNTVKSKCLELSGLQQIAQVRSDLDISKLRGYWLDAEKDSQHRLVQQCGCSVIVTARTLNKCWERFVYVKELMHVFDTQAEKASTPEKFEALLNELAAPSREWSEPMNSDVNSFWRALGILCPEHLRQEFISERKKSQTDDYAIALKLKIPQQYVPRLFESRYENWLKHENL